MRRASNFEVKHENEVQNFFERGGRVDDMRLGYGTKVMIADDFMLTGAGERFRPAMRVQRAAVRQPLHAVPVHR